MWHMSLIIATHQHYAWPDPNVLHSMCEFFINPRWIHRTERQGERGIWVVVCCYLLCEILPSLNSKEFFSSACFSCRAIIFMDATILPGATDFRAAMVLTSAMVLPSDMVLASAMILPSAIRIASYRHLRVGNVGGEYGYWLLKGNECYSAGVFPSNPILSGSAPNAIS